MAFAELSVVVEGAVESKEIFYDETLMSARIDEIEEDAASDGAHTLLYVTFHEHDRRAECTCAQRPASSPPYREFNNPLDPHTNTGC